MNLFLTLLLIPRSYYKLNIPRKRFNEGKYFFLLIRIDIFNIINRNNSALIFFSYLMHRIKFQTLANCTRQIIEC
ncbi:hypothetical protein C6Q17_21830 [Burkholderia contaminans]|nr:hypothetical protein C6Q17_21830 [Burkholderia contaminans]